MVWVRSEYAGELAVLSAWVSAMLPWSFTVASRDGVSLVVVRFPFFAFRFVYGIELGAAAVPFLPVWAAPGFPSSAAVARAYWVWLGAAIFVALAVALSVALYLAEQRVESGSVDPVRAMGLLLGAGAVLFTYAFVVLWGNYLGLTVPVGAVFLWAFAALLLTVERT